MSDEVKKERKQLGLAIPVTNKAKASSYDLKGNIIIDGKSYRFGAYKSQASGNGKMAAGQDYYYFHRVEPMDEAAAGALPACNCISAQENKERLQWQTKTFACCTMPQLKSSSSANPTMTPSEESMDVADSHSNPNSSKACDTCVLE